MIGRTLSTALAVLLLSSPSLGHGVWIAERWGELGVVYGHGAGDDPYDPAKLTRVEAIAEDGKLVNVVRRPAAGHMLLAPESEPAVIILDFDNGIYSKGPDGKWVNRPKSQVPGASEAGHYLKHNVTLVDVDGAIPPLPAQSLQIVPLSNPTKLGAGEPFRIRVLFEGRPLAGAAIMPDYVNISETKLGTTDANGEAEVVVRNDGLNVVAVSHEVLLAGNRDAAKRGHFATLSFVAGHDHED